MGDKMGWLLIIVAIAAFILVPYFKEASKSPEQKKYDHYGKTLSSYIEELKSAPPSQTASIKSKIDDLIRRYKVWKKHTGWGRGTNKRESSEGLDDTIRDYERVNTTNEKTIYTGGD